jgi:zinc transport system ATP-binding protein
MKRRVTSRFNDLALEVQHLTVHREGVLVLDDVTLTIPRGTCTALIGPNGSGKTSLLLAVLGLLTPSEGVIRVLGRHLEETRHRVGFLPQFKGFDRSFPATSLEVVVANLRGRWPARITGAEREKAMAALQRFGAAHLARRAVADLSGGELQRVYLARAMVLEPQLLLLDEPSTGLDPDARREVDGTLCQLSREDRLAMVVVTHDLRGLATYTDHVVYLDRRVVTEGDPQAILAAAPDHMLFGHVHVDQAPPGGDR